MCILYILHDKQYLPLGCSACSGVSCLPSSPTIAKRVVQAFSPFSTWNVLRSSTKRRLMRSFMLIWSGSYHLWTSKSRQEREEWRLALSTCSWWRRLQLTDSIIPNMDINMRRIFLQGPICIPKRHWIRTPDPYHHPSSNLQVRKHAADVWRVYHYV